MISLLLSLEIFRVNVGGRVLEGVVNIYLLLSLEIFYGKVCSTARECR